MKKNHYYVGVDTPKGMHLITRLEEGLAIWGDEEKPLEMTKKEAEDIRLRLSFSMCNAVVVSSYYKLDKQYFINWEIGK